MTKLRIALARWILGEHCACYKLGYHKLNDYNAIAKDKIKAKHE